MPVCPYSCFLCLSGGAANRLVRRVLSTLLPACSLPFFRTTKTQLWGSLCSQAVRRKAPPRPHLCRGHPPSFTLPPNAGSHLACDIASTLSRLMYLAGLALVGAQQMSILSLLFHLNHDGSCSGVPLALGARSEIGCAEQAPSVGAGIRGNSNSVCPSPHPRCRLGKRLPPAGRAAPQTRPRCAPAATSHALLPTNEFWPTWAPRVPAGRPPPRPPWGQTPETQVRIPL